MKYFIGQCRNCGGQIFWDTAGRKCIFHSIGDCLCECPYPKVFMEWWDENSCPFNIETFYSAWENSRQSLKNACEELDELIKTGSDLTLNKNQKLMIYDKLWNIIEAETIIGLLEKLA